MRRQFLLLIWTGAIFWGGVALAVDVTCPSITNVAQLSQISPADAFTNHFVQLEGGVLWAKPAEGKFVLRDGSGAALVTMDLRGQPLRAGERVRVTGCGPLLQSGPAIRLGVAGPVVNNDGVHAMREKSGAIWLAAGRRPLRLDWFNGAADYGLEAEFSGPGLPRQKIPDAILFRDAASSLNGLGCDCFEVAGETLPETTPANFLKRGVTKNFDIDFAARRDHVGLSFHGYIEVPRDGLYVFYTRSDDGSRLMIDAPSLKVEQIGAEPLPAPREVVLGQSLEKNCEWARASGVVTFASQTGGDLRLELRSATGRIRVEVEDVKQSLASNSIGRHVRATGVCLDAITADGGRIIDTLLVSGERGIEFPLDGQRFSPGKTNALRVLTTASEVHRLKREEAQRSFKVDISGVVTCVLPDHQGFTIQDAERGLYAVDFTTNHSRMPEIGAYIEIKGTTDPGLFAPVVNATEVIERGAGSLPEPIRPTWDQLLNGSLDAQYVEMQGIVTAVNSNGVTLLTREGRINIELRLANLNDSGFARFQGLLVHLRGCLFANWDYITHEVNAGEVRIYGAEISVDEAAGGDPFATPAKSFVQLLLFDPQAGAFKRVKVCGQILRAQENSFFLTDGTNGLRFSVNAPVKLAVGDLVEVVGFPDLSGISPVLREAAARKTGSAPLPPPKILPREDLVQNRYDALWVRVRGTLVSVRELPAEQLLEIQNGLRTFVARLPGKHQLDELLPIGCLLELNGVYSGLGGNKAVGQEISSFELLLNRITDIKVLARPPWWTLERLLFAVGALVFVLAITVLWITQLHRKVEARTAELEIQIKERERVEQQRVMEQERTRVAQDLHDELGSSLTEISMLAARAHTAAATDERQKEFLRQMSGKAREIVGALDEIVWAMNPRHDSMGSLVSYFSLYANHFLGLAGIAWKLEENGALPEVTVDSRSRHQLFLAYKEALTNVVHHSRATEVKIQFALENGEVRLSVADNGRGIPDALRSDEMDGVANMKARVEKLGGRFELSSGPHEGTRLMFAVPANGIL